MNNQITDAQVSYERLDQITISVLGNIELYPDERRDIAAAFLELKTLRERCDRMHNALAQLSDERIACGSCVHIAREALMPPSNAAGEQSK